MREGEQMPLMSKNTKSVVNFSAVPCKVTACAKIFEFQPYDVVVMPTQQHANVAVAQSRMARGPLDYFDPQRHFATVAEYRQKRLVGKAEIYPNVSETTDPDTLATVMTVGKRTVHKPTREQLKKATTQVLASYLLMLGRPAIEPETGKDLSKYRMLEQLYELFGYLLVDQEVVKPSIIPPRTLVEQRDFAERSPEPTIGKAPAPADDDDDPDEYINEG
jgi:hypothetical protein